MVLFMGFCCILLHLTSRFAAFYLAFWCILQCVLVQNAHLEKAAKELRGAYCSAFWCKMHCVLLHIAMCFGAKYVATTSD